MSKSGPPGVTAVDIEFAVAHFFGIRENIIVPNVSWGLFRDGHEADVVVIKTSQWAEEVEIKVSKADIKRDLGKRGGRGHARNPMMRRLWFAVPEALCDDPNIPGFAGVLAVAPGAGGSRGCGRVRVHRPASLNPGGRKLSDAEVAKTLRLAVFRLWDKKQARVRDLNEARYYAGLAEAKIAAELRWARRRDCDPWTGEPYPRPG